MIQERYCSFEVAKLLKENGFAEECEYFYDWYKESESYYICSNGGTCNNERYPDEYSMPTHQMTCDWLLEKYNLHIEVEAYPHEDGCFYWAYKVMELRKEANVLGYFKIISKAGFDTKGEAIDNAIKYVLENLI